MTIIITRKEYIELKRQEDAKKWRKVAAAGALSFGLSVSILGGAKVANACDCVDYYKVNTGDTLYSLSKKYGVTVDQLKSKNGFETDAIYVGQEIIVPYLDANGKLAVVDDSLPEKTPVSVKLPAKKPANTQNASTYVVQSGDSLWRISKKFNTSVDALVENNQLTSDALRPGQILKVTSAQASKSPATTVKPTVAKPAGSTDSKKYQAKAGDTIWSLAHRFQVSIDEIKEANHLSTNVIIIGQELKIPSKDVRSLTGTITGLVDNNSIEVSTNDGYMVMEIAYGSHANFSKFENKLVEITYTKGNNTQRPAVIHVAAK